ncbi:hypothetical protein H9P43_008074 [Blastocladiella emersonii ATCC 22665]|nr:hypothetical protein H9P43_008074 [Blastocladiella emersonii ATCC 22665]
MDSDLTPAAIAAANTADALRRMEFLQGAMELYNRTSAPVAAWLGLQFVERAYEDGVQITESVAKTICPRCGVLIMPSVNQDVSLLTPRGAWRRVVVKKEMKKKGTAPGKTLRAKLNTTCLNCQSVTTLRRVEKPRRAVPKPIAIPVLQAAVADATEVSTPTTSSNKAKGKEKSKTASPALSASKEKPTAKGKGKASASSSASSSRAASPSPSEASDASTPSRRALSKKKSTLRGLLSMQKKNEGGNKSLNLTDFLSNL